MPAANTTSQGDSFQTNNATSTISARAESPLLIMALVQTGS